MGNINNASSSNVCLTHSLCYHPDAVTDFSFSCRISLFQQTKLKSQRFFFSPVSVTNFIFLQKLVPIFQECSGQGRWGEISRTLVMPGSCFGSPLRHGCPYSLPILGSCGILPKKMNAAQPFCAYHKDVSNLQKLSRNDKTFPRCLCWFKCFLNPHCSGLYTGWLQIATFSNITQMQTK